MGRNEPGMADSVILVDKPAGVTSFDVIRRIRKAGIADKAGHAGTLDRFATGLLVLCTGCMTRLSRYFIEDDKEYVAEVRLGVRTDTDDCEGAIVGESPVPDSAWEALQEIAAGFIGEIVQRPPIYSALKIAGRRSSDLARKGRAVEPAARTVRIDALDILSTDRERGLFTLSVRCGKGTYIRSIARDMGDRLGVGAHLTALRRTVSGRFSVRDALPLDELTGKGGDARLEGPHVISARKAFDWCNAFIVGPGALWPVSNGAPFKRSDLVRAEMKGSNLSIILDEGENLIAIAHIDIDKWHVSYLNVFPGAMAGKA